MSNAILKKYLVTDANPRAQTALGPFAPHSDTDTRKYGHMFAAIGGSKSSHFFHVGRAVNEGLPWGPNRDRRCKWDEFKDRDGKPHDITLDSGTVVRQLICPQEVLDHVTRMEAQDSTDMCRRERILSEEQLKARDAANEYAVRTVEELTFGEEEVNRVPSEHEQMPKASANGWTAERRAAASAKAKARIAKSQLQPT